MPVSTEVETLISDAPVSAHLATAVDDRPHVAPVWYGYRDGVLYFIAGGEKRRNIRQNPRVALSIEKTSDGSVEWNVTLRGMGTINDDPDRIDWASGWIYDKYEARTDEERTPDDDSDDTVQTDGGEASEEEGALIEVRIGSASANIYR